MIKTNSRKTKDFKFKQFTIFGGFSGMPVSTDGVLLGAWADFKSPASILDIGTGTGLLALICAQRFPSAEVTALDIDNEAISAATINFEKSPWSERITLKQQDILSYPVQHRFDAIICNPPYFNSGEQSSISQRATARHTDTLNHGSLLIQCSKQLSPGGKACFILPVFEGEQFLSLASETGWQVSKVCRVSPTQNKPVHRLLIELGLQPGTFEETELRIRDKEDYSEQFTALTKDFYLKM